MESFEPLDCQNAACFVRAGALRVVVAVKVMQVYLVMTSAFRAGSREWIVARVRVEHL